MTTDQPHDEHAPRDPAQAADEQPTQVYERDDLNAAHPYERGDGAGTRGVAQPSPSPQQRPQAGQLPPQPGQAGAFPRHVAPQGPPQFGAPQPGASQHRPQGAPPQPGQQGPGPQHEARRAANPQVANQQQGSPQQGGANPQQRPAPGPALPTSAPQQPGQQRPNWSQPGTDSTARPQYGVPHSMGATTPTSPTGQSGPSSPYGRPQAPVQPGAGLGMGAPQRPSGPTPPTATFGAPFGVPVPNQPPQTQDAASDPKRGRRERKKSGRGAIAVLSVLLPVGIIAGGIAGYLLAHEIQSFDERKVEFEVAEVLRNDYGMSDLDTVNCPAWVKVEQGQSFQCEFEYAGATQTITVTQGAQSGQLVVGSPEK